MKNHILTLVHTALERPLVIEEDHWVAINVLDHPAPVEGGDVFGLGLGDQLRSWFADRKCSVGATAQHKRSLFSLFSNNPSEVTLKTGGKNIIAKIPFGLALEMHVVGEKMPRKVDWANITHISVSKPPVDWAKNI